MIWGQSPGERKELGNPAYVCPSMIHGHFLARAALALPKSLLVLTATLVVEVRETSGRSPTRSVFSGIVRRPPFHFCFMDTHVGIVWNCGVPTFGLENVARQSG